MKSQRKSGENVPMEHAEQVTYVNWHERTFPNVLIFAIPNGGLRNIQVALKLQAEGEKPGVPDLFVPEWRLFIEMKRRKGGRVSKEQKEMMEELERIGYTCLVGNGWEDAVKKVLHFLESTGRMHLTDQRIALTHCGDAGT